MFRPLSNRLQAIKIHEIKIISASSFLYGWTEISIFMSVFLKLPCTGLERPLRLQEVETQNEGGKVVSLTHRSPLAP